MDQEWGKSWWVLPGGSKEGLHCILIERVDEMLEVSELFLRRGTFSGLSVLFAAGITSLAAGKWRRNGALGEGCGRNCRRGTSLMLKLHLL